MKASDPEIPGCFVINRSIGYCCSKRLASFWPSIHPGSPQSRPQVQWITAETRSGLSPSLGGDDVHTYHVPSACLSTEKRLLNEWSRVLQSLLRDSRRPRPLRCRHLKFEEEQNGEGKEEGLRAGKGPARLAHTRSLEALPRAVVLTLGV